ncbi:MAG: L-glutamate gamma-semialdehyde dehydrogenase, partial [Pseudomonadota bacterium]
MKADARIEENVRRVGRDIFTLMGEDVPSFFDLKHWTGKMMQWAMTDEDVKVRLFRFVDALPALKKDGQAIDLLNEYFEDLDGTPILKGLGLIAGVGFLPHVAGKVVRGNVEALARRFIAGKNPEEALGPIVKLRDEGLTATVDLLGEEVLTDGEAAEYGGRYIDLVRFLGERSAEWKDIPILDRDHKGPIPRWDVSLKVSSFNPHFDPMDWTGSMEKAKAGILPVVEAAKELNGAVTFDMESYQSKNLTIGLFKAVFEEARDFGFPGIAIQAYLKDSEADLDHILRWAKKQAGRVAVRLTKGAYWDYETIIHRQLGRPIPVFPRKAETDVNFERLSGVLLENSEHIRPAFATHNIRSISRAIAVAEHLKLPKDAFEFQMIYGMAEPIRNALKKMGFRVRVYTPVGELLPGMAYLIRRLLENTSNESFLRKSFSEGATPEELTSPPNVEESSSEWDEAPDAFDNEPPTDFGVPENRNRMKEALSAVRKGLGKSHPLLVDGQDVRTTSEILSLNPARTDEIIGRQCAAGRAEAEQAVRAARRVWPEWRRTSSEDRAEYLFKAAEEMRRRRFEFAALEVYEVGKSWSEADADLDEAIDFLEYYGREMLRLGRPRSLGAYPGEENQYLYEPRGVGVVIGPWNFPIAIPTGMVSAGIVTGNCVIFKPSSLSPISGRRIAEVFRTVGLPQGVLQFVPGPGEEVGEYLVAHTGIDFIAFTGSKDVGLRIARTAADIRPGQRSIKKVIAEMGGKNAVIVDDTADLDAAVKGVLHSALGFQGQKCSACSRVIALENVFEAFWPRLKEAMLSVPIGPPEDPHNIMGPVVDSAALQKILGYLEIGKAEGKAKLVGERIPGGYFIGPSLFVDVSPDSPLAQEEIFGPVVAVMRAKDMDQALDIANGTPYSLTGGIFSRSPKNIRRAMEEFRVGNLYVNRKITGARVARQPFGGFGMSGVGSKTGGPDYLLQFMHPKSVCE